MIVLCSAFYSVKFGGKHADQFTAHNRLLFFQSKSSQSFHIVLIHPPKENK